MKAITFNENNKKKTLKYPLCHKILKYQTIVILQNKMLYLWEKLTLFTSQNLYIFSK